MKVSSYFKVNCRLINTVNKNYSHITELEELCRAFNSAQKDSYWAKEVGIEYDLLYKIAWETQWNHYHNDNPSPWGVQYILEKLKMSDNIEDIIPSVQLDKYPRVDLAKYGINIK